MKTKFLSTKLILSTVFVTAMLTLLYSCKKDDDAQPLPTITSFSPASGEEGTSVVISGNHFSSAIADNTVTFNSVVAAVTDANATQLTVTVPTGATTGAITVTSKGRIVTTDKSFTVTSASQVVSQAGGKLSGRDGILSVILPPGAVAANTTVSIKETEEVAPNGIGKVYTLTPEGTTFATPVQLSFHYTEAEAAITPPTSMAIGYKKSDNSWEVMPVKSIDQTTKTITTETTHFSQWTLLEVPTVAGFSPVSAKAGAIVTITGDNFSTNFSDNTVLFNGKSATVLSVTATALTAKVPVGATTGKLIVTTVFNGLNYTMNTVTDFVVESSDPSIDGFSPTHTPVGGLVTITGKNFSAVTSENTVMFNGTAATVVTTATSNGSTILTVQVPAGATTGKITIITIVNGLSVTVVSAGNFTIDSTDPVVTGFTPNHGAVGALITVTGNNFSNIVSENTVIFHGGIQGTVISATATVITVTVPAGATSGNVIVMTMYKGLSWTANSNIDFTVD